MIKNSCLNQNAMMVITLRSVGLMLNRKGDWGTEEGVIIR